MTYAFRIVLAQLNFTVGDIAANVRKHIDAAIVARDQFNAKMIVFSEMSLSGYPPEDLLYRKNFIDEIAKAVKTLQHTIQGIYCLVGHPELDQEKLFNTASLFYNGTLVQKYAKQYLPNYGVFDECRYFTPGSTSSIFSLEGIPTSIIICEDLWNKRPVDEAAQQGARLILCLNASPFEINKHEARVALLSQQAQQHNLAFLYINQVGAQDELIFEGDSLAVSPEGEIKVQAPFFQESLIPLEVLNTQGRLQIETTQTLAAVPNKIKRVYDALVFSLKDYVRKNHFSSVMLGLSGGIDSALTLAIAVDALSHQRVHAVMLPSAFTSDMSIEDSHLLANNLSLSLETISIEEVYQHFLQLLSPHLTDQKVGITEENLQARCRAIVLMALSNKQGHLLLTTGNRSELAVGYCTLYGDMAGGFAVLKDVPKTLVYQLAQYRNQIHPIIPQRIISRPPSAELAANQKDEDSLGSYQSLDQILYAYLNEGKSPEEIIAKGFDHLQVNHTIALIHRSEYKRRQAAIGPHINYQSFIKDWRYPITSGWKA